ncbi:CLUMA_CG017608, isoform A [Clunio marinus]|uniref:CLUMA_CG017608, isoform A n=1 Tax=Clunio marinus TaxID=568069 RepID=A0A1J1IWE4_9DIPT|nr:CLUMA_CG017608, isoform A [Clunio marinus]
MFRSGRFRKGFYFKQWENLAVSKKPLRRFLCLKLRKRKNMHSVETQRIEKKTFPPDKILTDF